MKNIRPNIYLFFFIIVISSLGSCNISSYLNDNQYLVKKNKVYIDDPQFSSNDSELIYNLESFVVQKPNRDYFLVPREWLYFRLQEKFEAPGKKKGIVKEAEKPVLHEDLSMFKTAELMEKYLRFSKGFYNAKVYPVAFLNNKRAEIHYHVTTQKQYSVRSKEYFGDDKNVMRIINRYENATLIKSGTPVDESIFEEEKSRIVKIMQNLGYANFSKTHIDFKADSSDLQVDVFAIINPPLNDTIHRRYKIGEIKVYPDYRGQIKKEYNNVNIVNGIEYYFDTKDYYVKPSALESAIEMNENQTYRKAKIDNTYAALANLGTYRFINITSSISEKNDTVINYNVLLTPIINTWAIDGSIALFYTNLAQNSINNSNNRLGLSANTSLSNINAFGGGEKFSVSLETTGEMNLPSFQFSNFSFKAQTGLRIPKFVDPFSVVQNYLFNPSEESQDKYSKFKNKVSSDINFSYSFNSQVQQFQTNSFNGNISYEWRPNQKFTYLYTPLNLNSLSTNLDPDFKKTFVDPNPLFARSFDKRFITGIIFQEFIYQMQSPVFSTGFSWGITWALEQSGGEISLLNLLSNFITGNDNEWAIDLGQNNTFQFSKYVLSNVDLHSRQIIVGEHSIAGRLKIGFALPYSLSNVQAATPFVKQYFVGGANSLRAWQTRELGPGGYADSFLNPTPNQSYFQSGDFVLESSLEYRFPIYYIIKGALFVDAGNVWTFSKDDSRTDSQLSSNFYKQIAVGYGTGVRIDLNFLVIRFDVGYKLRLPFRSPEFGNTYWQTPKFTKDYLSSANITIGINYPF